MCSICSFLPAPGPCTLFLSSFFLDEGSSSSTSLATCCRAVLSSGPQPYPPAHGSGVGCSISITKALFQSLLPKSSTWHVFGLGTHSPGQGLRPRRALWFCVKSHYCPVGHLLTWETRQARCSDATFFCVCSAGAATVARMPLASLILPTPLAIKYTMCLGCQQA